jgi:hypothetical protein
MSIEDPDYRRKISLAETPQPDPLLHERVSVLWGYAVVVLCAGLVALVLYAVNRYGQPQVATVPPPPIPIPDSPTSTTTPGTVPAPGDRATGTVGGPAAKTAPPPIRPARPVVQSDNPPLPATANEAPPDHPPTGR